MVGKRMTEVAQDAVRAHLRPGDVVVDATVGNGGDTLFLAAAVGEGGRVIAIDVQAAALERAQARAAQARLADRITFVQAGHQHLADLLATHLDGHTESGAGGLGGAGGAGGGGGGGGGGGLGAVMFNLGYLPGGDKALTTRPATTRAALRAAAGHLRVGGILSVVTYPGHAGGAAERDAVKGFFQALDPASFRAVGHSILNSTKPAPEWFGAVALK
ncbi:class I SAM-dependent methyltransferase [soil metagenome]